MANYTTLGSIWAGPTVSWHFNGAAGFLSEIQEAMDRWDALIDIDFVFVNSPAQADINMFFEPIDGPYNVLGEAGGPSQSVNGGPYYYTGDSIVRFDSAETWTWSAAAGSYVLGSGTTFYELVLHEVGHILGLGHSSNPNALMYFDAGGTATDITYWEEVGIRTLYAAETNPTGGPTVTVVVDQNNQFIWSQIATTRDGNNQITNVVTSFDNGNLSSEFFDVAGTETWQKSKIGKDAAGQTDYLDITYDTGLRIFTDSDQANAIIWTTALTFFDVNGQQESRRVNYDDGHFEVTYEDVASNLAWNKKIDSYTDGVNRDFVNFLYDDTSRKTIDFDQQTSELWSVKEIFYNALGQALAVNTLYDDATRILKSFDPAMANNTSEVTVGYDSLGRADFINTLYDDNTRIAIDYDQADTEVWSEHVLVYDASGALINDYFV